MKEFQNICILSCRVVASTKSVNEINIQFECFTKMYSSIILIDCDQTVICVANKVERLIGAPIFESDVD